MFGYLRFFSVFCTIIIVVFIAGVSLLAFKTIASEPADQNASAQDNSSLYQQCRTLPNILPTNYSTTSKTTQRPTRSQQNFRYIIPAVAQNIPAAPKLNPSLDTDTSPDSTQLDTVTKNQPTTEPAPLPLPLPVPVPSSVPETGTNNPFQYKEPEGAIGLVPRNISSLPAGIQVIGIMILGEHNSIAAIRIPKTNSTQRNTNPTQISDVFYVHEGDIIEVPLGNLVSNRASSTNRGTTNSAAEVLFLVVEQITPQHVEVRSRSNIADKHILR